MPLIGAANAGLTRMSGLTFDQGSTLFGCGCSALTRISHRFLLNECNCLDNKELWDSAKNSLFLLWCSAETSKRQAREAVLSLPSAWSRAVVSSLNDSLKKPTPRSKLRGIYGFLPFGTGRRPTRCFLGTLQRAAGNDQVQVAGSPGLVPGWRSLTQLPERGEYYGPLPAILPFAGLDQGENRRERERARRSL